LKVASFAEPTAAGEALKGWNGETADNADVTDQNADLSNTNEHGSRQIKNAEFSKAVVFHSTTFSSSLVRERFAHVILPDTAQASGSAVKSL